MRIAPLGELDQVPALDQAGADEARLCSGRLQERRAALRVALGAGQHATCPVLDTGEHGEVARGKLGERDLRLTDRRGVAQRDHQPGRRLGVEEALAGLLLHDGVSEAGDGVVVVSAQMGDDARHQRPLERSLAGDAPADGGRYGGAG